MPSGELLIGVYGITTLVFPCSQYLAVATSG